MARTDAMEFIEREISVPAIWANIWKMFEIERVPNATNFRASARLMEQWMRSAGLKSVERIQFPLDGRSRFGDLVMPPAWDCEEGYVELADASGKWQRIADWRDHPFVVGMWSPSTAAHPAEGELVGDREISDPTSAAGKVVLVHENSDVKAVYGRFKNSGALGLIHCGGAREAAPEDYHWENSWTDHRCWYPHGTPVTIPCLTVNYTTYRRLSALAAKSPRPRVRISVRSRTYAGKTDIITGVIPGDLPDEFVCVAHLYEPMINDDVSGAAAIVEIARVMNAMIAKGLLKRPRRTLRLLAGWEFYGFNAYYQTHRKERERAFAGASFDGTGIPMSAHSVAARFLMSSPSRPCFLDAFFAGIAEERLRKHVHYQRMERLPATLGDDLFLSSFGIDIPTYWLYQSVGRTHHMELNNRTQMIDNEYLRAQIEGWCAAIAAVLTAGDDDTIRMAHLSVERAVAEMSEEIGEFLLSPGDAQTLERAEDRFAYLETIEKMRLDGVADFAGGSKKVSKAVSGLRRRFGTSCREQRQRLQGAFGAVRAAKRTPGPAEKAASDMAPRVKIIGPIACLPDVPDARLPKAPRLPLKVQGWMDGRRDLATCARMGFHEEKLVPTEQDFREWVVYVETLKEYGYFALNTDD